MSTHQFFIPPFITEIDGVKVQIIEARKKKLVSGDEFYLVVVSINYKGIWSKKYTLNVKDMDELIDKLKIEITKIKFIDYAYGLDEVKRIIT